MSSTFHIGTLTWPGNPSPVFVSSSGAASGGGSVTVSMPAGIQVGDYLLAAVAGSGSGGFGLAGWTGEGSGATFYTPVGSSSMGWLARIATIGDIGASYTFSGAQTVGVVAYRGGTNTVDTGAVFHGDSPGNYVASADAPSITPATPGDLWIVAYFNDQVGGFPYTTPTGFTQREEVGIATSFYLMIAEQGPLTSTSPTGPATASLIGGTAQNIASSFLLH